MLVMMKDDDGDDDADDAGDVDAEGQCKALLCKSLECSHGSARNTRSIRSPTFARS